MKFNVSRLFLLRLHAINSRTAERCSVSKFELFNYQFRMPWVSFKLVPLLGPTQYTIQDLILLCAGLPIRDSLCLQLVRLLQFCLQPIQIRASTGAAIVVAVNERSDATLRVVEYTNVPPLLA